jgi:hypothetical protein
MFVKNRRRTFPPYRRLSCSATGYLPLDRHLAQNFSPGNRISLTAPILVQKGGGVHFCRSLSPYPSNIRATFTGPRLSPRSVGRFDAIT